MSITVFECFKRTIIAILGCSLLVFLGCSANANLPDAEDVSLAATGYSNQTPIQEYLSRERLTVTGERPGYWSTLDRVDSAHEVTVKPLRDSRSPFSRIENKVIVFKHEQDAIKSFDEWERAGFGFSYSGFISSGPPIQPPIIADQVKGWMPRTNTGAYVVIIREGTIRFSFMFSGFFVEGGPTEEEAHRVIDIIMRSWK